MPRFVRDTLGSFVPLKAAYDDPATLGPYTYKNFGPDFAYGGYYTQEAADRDRVPAIGYSEFDPVVRNAVLAAQLKLQTDNQITARQLLDLEIAEVKAVLPDAKIR